MEQRSSKPHNKPIASIRTLISERLGPWPIHAVSTLLPLAQISSASPSPPAARTQVLGERRLKLITPPTVSVTATTTPSKMRRIELLPPVTVLYRDFHPL
ncbi:hypothetical protein FRC09_013564, partial [Ceratobasidium sp. 395]